MNRVNWGSRQRPSLVHLVVIAILAMVVGAVYSKWLHLPIEEASFGSSAALVIDSGSRLQMAP